MTTAPDPYLPGRGDDRYDAEHYELELAYLPVSNRLEASATIDVVVRSDLDVIVLDLAGLRVRDVRVDGAAARWRHRGTKLRVDPPEVLRAGTKARIAVRYEGNPGPVGSPWGPVGWEQLADGVLVAAQPSGACTWFPCNDAAAQKAPFTVHASVPAPYVAVANGAFTGSTRGASRTTWSYEQREPTSPYLMALHVGRYQIETMGGPVPVRLVATSEHLPAARRAFERKGAMLDAFSEQFGPYPLAAGHTVVVCGEPLEIPVEAQGQSIFGTNHLDRRHERLIAHELAHQWFGNSLTAATWRDIWLHEGFACYAEWLWSEAAGDAPASTHAREHHRRLAALPQDLVLDDPGAADMFDDRVYKRGALTLHELRRALGDAVFFDLLRRWTAEHRHGLVTTAAFRDAVADAAGQRYDGFFDAWLRGAALPPLTTA